MREEEHRRRLTDYFKKNLKKGYTADSLKWALIAQGYSRTAVEKAIVQSTQELAREAPILEAKPTIIHDVIDEDNMPVKKSWWRRLLGL